jgi:hypothetical protein
MMNGDKLPPEFAMATVLERAFIEKMLRQVKVHAEDGATYISCDAGTFVIRQRGDAENWWVLRLLSKGTEPEVAQWWRAPHSATTRLSLLQTWTNWWNNKYVNNDHRRI